jgi:hypothetical protein
MSRKNQKSLAGAPSETMATVCFGYEGLQLKAISQKRVRP